MSDETPALDELLDMLYGQLGRAQAKLRSQLDALWTDKRRDWDVRAMEDEYLRARYTVETYEIRREIAQIKKLEAQATALKPVTISA